NLQHKSSITLFDLFNFNETIEHVVTYFLALLEMAKTGMIQIQQTKAFHNFDITKGVNYDIQS
ncbi:segregation/condensation protein A, partial [Staphylococcus chromogenes]|uniref:segregation/condensation protein A n=1 Tax=Staphylococcus chromogenes TaxID=46126 RepID=UPI000D447F1F